ncbi:FAD-dependent oxidoreductase [Dactylosporangium sp. NPDC051484]|uniref:FAD-dependent oxidoreductase n=1 Tax=Dactylosporangium sp. NPDC051484 TaxID=3154942 RepID=UPI00344B688C
MVTVAIIGSGPAGCYTAQFLRKRLPDAAITVFDRLPVPFGLVRYGVAPDHQGTKAVTRQFDRLFEREGVRFAGNVEVGTDVSTDQIEANFDVIVVATGLDDDRLLDIPGEDHPRVIGAGRIVRMINGHPDSAGEEIRLGANLVLIGNGNVAGDLMRLLLKPLDAFADSDVDDAVLRRLRGAGVRRLEVIGRSPMAAAKFDPVVLRELRGLPGVRFDVDGESADDPSRIAEVIRELRDSSDPAAGTTVVLRFGWTPQRILADGDACLVEFAASDGSRLRLGADAVITAIGFQHSSKRLYPGDDTGPEVISALPSIYRTGWYRRGPRGTIPENRVDAREVADAIAADVEAGKVRTGRPGWPGLPEHVRERAVDFSGWRAIDAHEVAHASAGRFRSKVTDREQLLRLASRNVVADGDRMEVDR